MKTTPLPATSPFSPNRRTRVTTLLLAATMTVTACGNDPEGPATPAGDGPLAGVCPDPIVAQTGWWPQAEHAALYHLVGEDYTVDVEGLRVTAPLVASGVDTGVRIEVRAGGPAIGFQRPSATLYADDDITLAVVHTAMSVTGSVATPVIGVVALLDVFPNMIMWDPERYPDFETIADIGRSDVTVLYFPGAPEMEYLLNQGILRRDQVEDGYDGTPSRWVAEDGAIAQQSFATSEPYTYENTLEQWNKPVRFQLIHEVGYENYDLLSIRAADRAALAPCLELLVPMVQQSVVDYVADPAATNALIVELAEAYQGHPYTFDHAQWSHQQMLDLGIIGNAADGTLGDIELDRVAEVIGIVSPIYVSQGVDIQADLAPSDLVTNEFIDESIGLP